MTIKTATTAALCTVTLAAGALALAGPASAMSAGAKSNGSAGTSTDAQRDYGTSSQTLTEAATPAAGTLTQLTNAAMAKASSAVISIKATGADPSVTTGWAHGDAVSLAEKHSYGTLYTITIGPTQYQRASNAKVAGKLLGFTGKQAKKLGTKWEYRDISTNYPGLTGLPVPAVGITALRYLTYMPAQTNGTANGTTSNTTSTVKTVKAGNARAYRFSATVLYTPSTVTIGKSSHLVLNMTSAQKSTTISGYGSKTKTISAPKKAIPVTSLSV